MNSFDNTFAIFANYNTASFLIYYLASSPLESISNAINDSDNSGPKSTANYPKSYKKLNKTQTLTAIITFSSLLSSWAIEITYVSIKLPLSRSFNSFATILIELPASSLI